jgi:hypothetical protein
MAELVSVKSAGEAPPGPSGTPGNSGADPHILAAYKQMLVALFTATLLISVVLITIILWFNYGHKDVAALVRPSAGNRDAPLMIVLIFAGALGAFFSALIRLYNFADLPKALVDPGLGQLPSGYLTIYSLVPPVVGAIAATVLYISFAAGLLQGVLFPAFACKLLDPASPTGAFLSNEQCNTFGHTISDYGPALATDYAKALIWAFVAGFAERLVPDALQSFAAKAEKSAQQDKG